MDFLQQPCRNPPICNTEQRLSRKVCSGRVPIQRAASTPSALPGSADGGGGPQVLQQVLLFVGADPGSCVPAVSLRSSSVYGWENVSSHKRKLFLFLLFKCIFINFCTLVFVNLSLYLYIYKEGKKLKLNPSSCPQSQSCQTFQLSLVHMT